MLFVNTLCSASAATEEMLRARNPIERNNTKYYCRAAIEWPCGFVFDSVLLLRRPDRSYSDRRECAAVMRVASGLTGEEEEVPRFRVRKTLRAGKK